MPILEFLNYQHTSQMTKPDSKVVASHIGRTHAHRSRPVQQKKGSSQAWDPAWARSKFRVVAPIRSEGQGPRSTERAGTALASRSTRGTAIQTRVEGPERTVEKGHRLFMQPERSNADVFDPFEQSTLSAVQGSYRLVDFYSSYAQKCAATSSVISTALKDTTYLFTLLSYVSLIMERLGVGGKRAASEYYSAKSLSLVRQELASESPMSDTCLQAMTWLGVAALWQGKPDVARIHMAGIKALLGHDQLDELPSEWVEAILFCDLWTALPDLNRPIFPTSPDALCTPLPPDTKDSEQLRPRSLKAVSQIDVELHHQAQEFVDCAHSWVSKFSAWGTGSGVSEIIYATNRIIQRALDLALKPDLKHSDQCTLSIMLILGSLLLISPISGAPISGEGSHPLWSRAVYPVFSAEALDKLVPDHKKARRALQLWNDNLNFIRKDHPRVDDLDFFIYKMTLPVRILAGEKYDEFPRFLKAYLLQLWKYTDHSMSSPPGDTSFKLREKLYGYAIAVHALVPIL